jgi:hypothetical protein
MLTTMMHDATERKTTMEGPMIRAASKSFSINIAMKIAPMNTVAKHASDASVRTTMMKK